MAIYHFDLEFGGAVCRDDVGAEFPSLELAIAEMCRTLVYIARVDKPTANTGWKLVGSLREEDKQVWRAKIARVQGIDASAPGEILAFA